MAELTIIVATTSAVTKREVNLQAYENGILSVDALAGAEEVDVFISVNGGWEVAPDTDGTAIKLTTTQTTKVLQGGAIYAVDKDSTAGACAVTLTLGRGINS